MRSYKFLIPITGLFTATLLISNTLDNKLFMLGSLALPAGIIVFPLAYVFGDMLTEVYGYAQSRRVIWTGLSALVGLYLSLNFGLATQWMSPGQQGFHVVLVTSMLVLLCTRAGRVFGIDSLILRRASPGVRRWLRVIM